MIYPLIVSVLLVTSCVSEETPIVGLAMAVFSTLYNLISDFRHWRRRSCGTVELWASHQNIRFKLI